jgi:hypothetical protein
MASTRVGGAPVTTAHYARYAASLLSGCVAAVVGAVAMVLVMAIAFMAVERTSFFYALRPIGSILFGDEMLTAPTPAMYLAAAGLHFGIAIFWGLAYAVAATLLAIDKSKSGALALGLVVGLTAQIVDVNLIAPSLLQSLWGRDFWAAIVPPFVSWLGHVAFGASFVVAPALFPQLWLRFVGRGDLLRDDPRLA